LPADVLAVTAIVIAERALDGILNLRPA